MKIPKGRFNLDLKKLIGKELAITVSDDEYDGKISSRITDWFPTSEFEADVMEDEDEEVEEDEEEDEDFDEDEEDEGEDEEEEEDEDEEEEDEDDDVEEVDLDDI
jgi:hypothetical protein